MLQHGEKRTYTRMETNCKMTYKFPESEQRHEATCINLSGAGILFKATDDIEVGRAVEICVMPENNITPSMTAFIEVTRSSPTEDKKYEIAASIKGIKAN